MMSSISSIGGVIALPVSHRGTIWFVCIWAQSHRLFCRFVLGQRIVVEGEMPDIPVLYVFKHESAFETVEQPMLFKHPAVFAKEELFSIRSEEHTSELQSLMRISYAVFCLKKKQNKTFTNKVTQLMS